MPAQKGSLVLIKIGNGGSPESFATIGGLRTSRLILNNQRLDASNVETGAWQKILSASGVRSLLISGSGLFTDTATEEAIRGYAFNGTLNNYQFYFANGDFVSGAFQVTSYERSGDYDAEENYSITLESSGNISFTAT